MRKSDLETRREHDSFICKFSACYLSRVKERNRHTQSTKQGNLQHQSKDDENKIVIITKIKVII
jgi:hypothetical protein